MMMATLICVFADCQEAKTAIITLLIMFAEGEDNRSRTYGFARTWASPAFALLTTTS